jgi:hypothetical protein
MDLLKFYFVLFIIELFLAIFEKSITDDYACDYCHVFKGFQ